MLLVKIIELEVPTYLVRFSQKSLDETQIELIYKNKIIIMISNKGETNVKVMWCPHKLI